METPARCQGCTEQIASLEHRLAEMEKFFATLAGPLPPARATAARRAQERWHPQAS